MKILFALLCIFLSVSMAMNLIKDGTSSKIPDIQQIIEVNVGGVDLIADEIISFSQNKLKVQYTTFGGKIPAFDVLLDFTAGTMFFYQNLTGECTVSKIVKIDFEKYYTDLITHHVKYIGKRGQYLDLYEIKHPKEKGSRTWLYGQWASGEDSKVFYPTRFQSHHPSQKVADYSGEWLDVITEPHITNATFDYPECQQANTRKLDIPFTVGILGVNSDVLISLMN